MHEGSSDGSRCRRHGQLKPRSSLYQVLIGAGARLRSLQQVHAHLIVSGLLHCSLPILTKLSTLAVTAGAIVYARQIFLSIPNPDAFLFTSLINSTSKSRFPIDSIFFYNRMILCNISPSNYALTAVIKACAESSAAKLGRSIHCHAMVHGYSADSFVQAALISLYEKSGDLSTARKVFDKMPEKTVIAWNSIISAYDHHGFPEKSIELFHRMKNSRIEFDSTTLVIILSACAQIGALDLGIWVHNHIKNTPIDSNIVLSTALINMYVKSGNMIEARKVFDSIEKPNVVAYTSLISGYGSHGHGKEAIKLFHSMILNGLSPNEITFVSLLSACAHSGLIQEGWQALAAMKKLGLTPTMEHHVCIVDMLGRAGLLDIAYRYIKELKPDPGPEVWTAMLGACKVHKKFDLGEEMADHLLAAEPESPAHYVLISNVYALFGRVDRVESVRNTMIRKGLKKKVGFSSIEVDGETHMFGIGDKSHPDTVFIYKFLDDLMKKCINDGYFPVF